MLYGSCFCENLWLNAPVRFITVAFSLPPHPTPQGEGKCCVPSPWGEG